MANIRTSLPFPTRPWETAKNKFLENLSPEEIQQFQNATLENFFYDASSAQKKHARGSRVWELQEKLASLAEGIDDYGKALDVYSNAYGLILCPIWGSVRVVLNIALEAGKFQEKIVDMFARIGDALPRFRIYQSLFRKHERLLRALSAAYLDILKFCIMAKDFFLRARTSAIPMSIICMAIWKPFQKQFNDYIVAFRTHQKMVEKEAGLAHLIESARSREIELANRALQERNEKIHRRHRIFSALPSIGYQTKHDIICSHRHPGTNTWLQTHYNFVGWLSSQSSDCLSCFGIPGSGKSVLSASTIDYLIELSQPSSVVCYYYCDYADPLSLDASRLIATIIKQVLVHLPLDHFNDAFDCPFETDRPTPSHSKCQEFLLRLFENFTEVFIVLDGIDELAQYSQSIVLNMVNDLLHSSRTRVKVFVTSRCEECLIRESLESYRVIDLGTDHLQADVELFVTRKLESTILSQRLDFSDSLLKREIIQALVNGANGMFLWVKFQLDDICEAMTEEAIRQTLQTLPKDLGETYFRIIEKIRQSPGGTLKIEMMKKIVRWVICARRPLRIDELEEAVGLEKTDIYLHTERSATGAGRKLMAACGNLLVYNKEDRTVTLAHSTVQQFLCNSSLTTDVHFNFSAADTEIGEMCVAYLCFSDFETQLTKTPIPVLVDQKEAEQIIWNAVPLSSYVRTLTSRWYSRRSLSSDESSTLRFSFPVVAGPAPALTAKYACLQYVIDFWVFHTAQFTSQTSSWDSFKMVAFERNLVFEFRPWKNPPIRKRYTLNPENGWIHIYSWALEHGIWSLLHLLPPDTQYPLRQEFLTQIRRISSRPNFSHGHLLYEIAKESFWDVAKLKLRFACSELRNCCEDTLPFDSMIEESILIAGQFGKSNIISTILLVSDTDFDRLFISIVNHGHFKNHTIIMALVCYRDGFHISDIINWELAFALYRCLPTIADAVRHLLKVPMMNYRYGYILLALASSSIHEYYRLIVKLSKQLAYMPIQQEFYLSKSIERVDSSWPPTFSQQMNYLNGKSLLAIVFGNIQQDPSESSTLTNETFTEIFRSFWDEYSDQKQSWPKFIDYLERSGTHCLAWAARWGFVEVVTLLMPHYQSFIHDEEKERVEISSAALANAMNYSRPCLEEMIMHNWPKHIAEKVMDNPNFSEQENWVQHRFLFFIGATRIKLLPCAPDRFRTKFRTNMFPSSGSPTLEQ